MKKYLFKNLSKVLIRYLQKRYIRVTKANKFNCTNRVINELILIQSILYFFRESYSAWGYFHPSCVWSDKDELEFEKLFPNKPEMDELDIVVEHNPSAVTYYKNKIYDMTPRDKYHKSPSYSVQIKNQLKAWNEWK